MKLLFSLMAACVAGVALGWTVAWEHIHRPAWEGLPTAEELSPTRAVPRVAVDKELFDFGVMDAAGTGSHAFVFTNKGDAPLTLKPGATSCKCTLSRLEKSELGPGESTNVTVEWHPKEVVGRFVQTAKIVTNDPVQGEMVLSVSGEVTVAVRPDPSSLVFSRITVDETAHADVRLWCYLAGKPLEITDYKMANDATANFFSVTHEPIPKSEVSQEKNAKSGVLMHVTIKPGLPQGSFQQTILIATNREEATHVEVPIVGTLSGDIVVAGPDWDDEQNALVLGAVKSRKGASRRLSLIVRGPHSAQTQFKVSRIEPDYLKVTLGKTVQVGSGPEAHISQTPLVIEVPANSPLESHLGSEQGRSGVILLDTTHPQVKQLKIRVRFAVEGGS